MPRDDTALFGKRSAHQDHHHSVAVIPAPPQTITTEEKTTKEVFQLPVKYTRVLQALVAGHGVKANLVYQCHSNLRFAIRLDGPWQVPMVKHVQEARMCGQQGGINLFPKDASLDKFMTHESVLLKMQPANQADAEEDQCHAKVNATCKDMSPHLIASMTISGIRVTFMEWLPGCISLHDLKTDCSPLLNMSFYSKIEDMVRRMWTDAGVLHCDLHMNNVLVQEQTHRVYIIDYGMAVAMTDKVQHDLKAALKTCSTLPEAYDTVCKEMVYHAIVKRGYIVKDDSDWNDDATFLRDLKKECCKMQRLHNAFKKSRF